MTLTDETYTATHAADPDLLEELMWARGLHAMFWTVGDPEPVDEEHPEDYVATLQVIWTNGRRPFMADVVLDYDVIHALVGSDEVPQGATDAALEQLLERASEIDPAILVEVTDSPAWAEASGSRRLGDGDLLRGAAQMIGGEWGVLMEALGALVDEIPPGTSYADTRSRVASIAVQIAWDLL